MRRFLNAPRKEDIVFVRGTTEAINLVAQSWGRRNIGPGDEIVLSLLEHHSNIVPWQLLCAEKGAKLDRDGIAVRSGHHCAQPALRRFGLEQSVRPSLALYNTCEDIDALVASIRDLQRDRGIR